MNRYLPYFCCLLLSLGIANFRLGPVMMSPENFIIGGWGHPDNLGNHWLLVWVSERLLEGESIIHNNQYYVPFGDYPWLAGNGSEGILHLPFYLLFGWPVGATMMLISLFVATGFAGYALGRVVGGGPWVSLIASSIILSAPYLSRELSGGRFSQVDVFWLTASVACFLWLWKRPTWKVSILCGGFVGVTSILYWYYGFFFVLTAFVCVVASLITRETIPWRAIIGAAFCSLLIAGPVLYIYLSNWQSIPGVMEESFPAIEAYYDALQPTWPFVHQQGRRAGATQSIPVLLLSVSALWMVLRNKQQQERRMILTALLVILFFWLLAMGPNTPVFSYVYGLIGPLKRFWWPSRHLMMINFGYTILAVVGARLLIQKIKVFRKGEMVLGIGCAIAVPLSIWLQGDRPFHAFHSPVRLPPEVYVELSSIEGEGIWQPPLNPKIATTQVPLLFQLYHQKKMLNGHALWVDRVRPEGWDEMIAEHPLLGPLQSYEEAEFSGMIEVTKQDVQELLDIGIELAVIDQELFCTKTPQVLMAYNKVLRHFFGEPIMNKDGVRVWSLHNWTDNGAIELAAWKWPKKVGKGTGTRGLWGPLHKSKVLINHDE